MISSVEDAEEPMEEEIPKILSPGIWDVFPFFVNMLDIKSFMKLAMTSKGMYNRCMEDKRIKIKFKENEVFGENYNGSPIFFLLSYVVRKGMEEHEKYLNMLRNLSCNVSLRHVFLNGNGQIDDDLIYRAKNYLKDIGVKEIGLLEICRNATAWQEIISLIKNFHVQHLSIGRSSDVPDVILQSLFELNLLRFSYDGAIEGSWLIDIDLRIPEVVLANLSVRSRENFLSLIWKIQKGTLTSLTIKQDAVDWSQFETLNYSRNESLPEERPLVFFEDSPYVPTRHYWFLHWNGAVIKCVFTKYNVKITKCDPIDFPRSLKKKEDVHKALTERKTVDCLLSHFTSFFEENFTILESSEDPLPEERPLFFKSGNEAYFILHENGNLEKISWAARGSVSYENFDLKSNWPSACEHPALARHVFNTQLESNSTSTHFLCSDANTLNVERFFEKYKQLPFDSCGPLPEERPVLFEIPSSYCDREDCNGAFAVLREDGSVVKCAWSSSREDNSYSFKIDKCPDFWIPSVAMSVDILQSILMKAPPVQDLYYRLDLKLFRSGFDKFKAVPFDHGDPLPEERPLVMVKTEVNINGEEEKEERWFYQFGRITKCEWRSSQASFSKADPWDLPLALKIVFSNEHYDRARHSIEKSPKEIRRLIRGCRHLHFEHEGPLPEERPLVFDIGRGYVYLAEDDTVQLLEFDYDDKKASMHLCPSWRMPSALIATYRLREILLQLPSGEEYARRLKLETFLSAFEGIQTVSLDFAGTLSEERPLIFKKTEEISGELVEKRWFLFGDGDDDTVKECIWRNGTVSITDAKKRDLPLPLMKHFINDLLLEAYKEPIQLEIDYFPACLEGRITLPHNHWGEFEDGRRPLVFVKPEEPKVRILFLIDDNLLKCEFGEGRVFLEKCRREEIPSVLVIAKDIEEIIMEEPTRHEILYRLGMEKFVAGFSRFKTLPFDFSDPLPDERPLVFEKNEEDSEGHPIMHLWSLQNNFVTKSEWKDGFASFSSADPRDSPLVVTTTLLKDHLEGKWLYKGGSVFLDYNVFLSCLKEFTILPFDFNGRLPEERPLIFEKTEVKHPSHLCPDEDCGCSHLVHSLWRLYDAEEVLFCSWNDNQAIFDQFIATDGLPPVLKTKYYLKNILFEKMWPEGSWEVEWQGNYKDFLACFKDYTRLSHDHDGPLPKDRPLIFAEELGEDKANFWILRDDDTVIECSYCEGLTLTVSPDDYLPSFLERHLNLQDSLEVSTCSSSSSYASDSVSLSSSSHSSDSSDSTLSSD